MVWIDFLKKVWTIVHGFDQFLKMIMDVHGFDQVF